MLRKIALQIVPFVLLLPFVTGATAQSQGSNIVPFRIHVPDEVLADLKQRLARTRFPDEIPSTGWDYGTDLQYLKELVAYWRERFDWRAQERR